MGTGRKGHLFQGKRGTKAQFLGEQRNKDNSGEQGTYEKYERGQRSGIDTIKYQT